MDEGFPFDPKVWHEGPSQWWPGLELRHSDQLSPAELRHREDGEWEPGEDRVKLQRMRGFNTRAKPCILREVGREAMLTAALTWL